ncbi:DUF397 domain-containing protein [Actinomadura rugatobispora]|uniref:DUF397 domain-containing protein n=1 Tax=Actinomadura rugatobispora TaxID=1994 RepID=A0ABW1AEC4_9ACTN|nr:DUF397 domain-containing protein [Actinomadura rugatobispora]
MSDLDLAQGVFRKSSYSGSDGCVETCVIGSRRLVRDSQDPDGGCVVLHGAAWNTLLSKIKQGTFDL